MDDLHFTKVPLCCNHNKPMDVFVPCLTRRVLCCCCDSWCHVRISTKSECRLVQFVELAHHGTCCIRGHVHHFHLGIQGLIPEGFCTLAACSLHQGTFQTPTGIIVVSPSVEVPSTVALPTVKSTDWLPFTSSSDSLESVPSGRAIPSATTFLGGQKAEGRVLSVIHCIARLRIFNAEFRSRVTKRVVLLSELPQFGHTRHLNTFFVFSFFLTCK